MSPDPLPSQIAPLSQERSSLLPNRSLPMKATGATDSQASPTLHSLLMRPSASPNQQLEPKQQQQKVNQLHKKVVSDVSNVAVEALRITQEKANQENLTELRPNGELPKPVSPRQTGSGGGSRLNKFVRRLHDMLQAEKDNGIIEWRKGLLVLHSTAEFAKNILPKFFNTRNFKTFRRQLNYYGFVHVRSFSTAASSTTALWVNQELAELASADIGSVLTLKRVEPCELQKTAEGRRQRKEMAMHTVEEDLKIDPKSLHLEQIQNLARRGATGVTATTTTTTATTTMKSSPADHSNIPTEISFANTRSLPQQESSVENVVSDDTQSASSSVAPTRRSCQDLMADDNMGAANLLLLLSKGGC